MDRYRAPFGPSAGSITWHDRQTAAYRSPPALNLAVSIQKRAFWYPYVMRQPRTGTCGYSPHRDGGSVSRIPPLRRSGRALGLLTALLAVIGLTVTPAMAEPPNGSNKIEAQLAETFDVKSAVDFYVEFAEQADLSAAAGIEDWNQRGEAVVAALQRTANSSQADVRKYLDLQQADYQPFW